jgi:hypothetical protein
MNTDHPHITNNTSHKARLARATTLLCEAVDKGIFRILPEPFIGALSLVKPYPEEPSLGIDALDSGKRDPLWRKAGRDAVERYGLLTQWPNLISTQEVHQLTGSRAAVAYTFDFTESDVSLTRVREIHEAIRAKWSTPGTVLAGCETVTQKTFSSILPDNTVLPGIENIQRYIRKIDEPLIDLDVRCLALLRTYFSTVGLHAGITDPRNVALEHLQGPTGLLATEVTAAAVYWKLAWSVMRYGTEDTHKTLQSVIRVRGDFGVYWVDVFDSSQGCFGRLITIGPRALEQYVLRIESPLSVVQLDGPVYSQLHCF